MHKQWEDLIPFYAAQTLSRQEAAALEQHLIGCDACRRSLDEWRTIAAAVRMQAASQLRDLPALTLPRARAQASMKRRADPWRWLTPMALASAVVAVIIGGGLILLIISRSLRPLEEAAPTSVAVLMTNTPDVTSTSEPPTPLIFSTMPPSTAAPTLTPFPPTTRPIQRFTVPPIVPTRIPFTPQPPLTDPYNALGVTTVPDTAPLTLATATPLPFPTPLTTNAAETLLVLPEDGVCRLSAVLSQFSLYAGPGFGYAPLIDLTAQYPLRPLAVGDNGWYRVEANIRGGGWLGWVRPDVVVSTGDCTVLPVLATGNYLPESGVPTAGAPMAVTVTPSPDVPTDVPEILITEVTDEAVIEAN